MSPTLLVLVPLLLLPVVGLLAFVGCGTPVDTSVPSDPTPQPPPTTTPPKTTPPEPPRPAYAEVVRATDGLVAHWPLDDPPAATAVRDIGPSTLNGEYVDGPPDVERSRPDGALALRDPGDRCAGFPGQTAHIRVPHSGLLNPGGMAPRFSFEVWARLRDPAAQAGTSEHLASSRLFTSATESSGWDLFVRYGDGGVPTFTARVFGGPGPETEAAILVQSTTTPPDGAWHHVVMTYEGAGEGTLRLVVRLRGEPTVFPAAASPAPYVANPSRGLTFGAAVALQPSSFFTGDLDQAAFYNAVLDPGVIETHHGAAQP